MTTRGRSDHRLLQRLRGADTIGVRSHRRRPAEWCASRSRRGPPRARARAPVLPALAPLGEDVLPPHARSPAPPPRRPSPTSATRARSSERKVTRVIARTRSRSTRRRTGRTSASACRRRGRRRDVVRPARRLRPSRELGRQPRRGARQRRRPAGDAANPASRSPAARSRGRSATRWPSPSACTPSPSCCMDHARGPVPHPRLRRRVEFLTNQSVSDMVLKFSEPLEACRAVVAESYRLWLSTRCAPTTSRRSSRSSSTPRAPSPRRTLPVESRTR